jgi:hypothetical protein
MRAMTRAARSGKCWSSQRWNSGIHLPGQAQARCRTPSSPGGRGGLEDALDLGLVDERDDRRDAHADRHARACQRLDGADAPVRRGGARLEDARQRGVERGHRHVHRRQPALAHGRDEVEVALDPRRLRDQRERMRALGQDRDHRARDAELALDGW